MLVPTWDIEQGISRAHDVAKATNQNRIALHGVLDLVNEQLDDVVIALINANGCAKAQPKIHGPFQSPVVENPNVVASITGSGVNLYKTGRGRVPGGTCEVFYPVWGPAPR